MLGRPDEQGRLGVAEGIETTLAAMQKFEVPGWGPTRGGRMEKLAGWMLANPDQVREIGIRTLLVWADAGEAGVGAGNELVNAAQQIGIQAKMFVPHGGDDFNDDLVKGYSHSDPVDDIPEPESV